MRGLALAVALSIAASSIAYTKSLKEYDTEQRAQKHCPKDVVVWSEFKGGGLFHPKDSPRYGKTPDGGYLCRKEAEAMGWKEFRKSD